METLGLCPRRTYCSSCHCICVTFQINCDFLLVLCRHKDALAARITEQLNDITALGCSDCFDQRRILSVPDHRHRIRCGLSDGLILRRGRDGLFLLLRFFRCAAGVGGRFFGDSLFGLTGVLRTVFDCVHFLHDCLIAVGIGEGRERHDRCRGEHHRDGEEDRQQPLLHACNSFQ